MRVHALFTWGFSLKSHINREKRKAKREAIVNLVSTRLVLNVRNKMKGNKMSAILAILLMLSGAIFPVMVIRRAEAGSFPLYDQPASAIAVNTHPGGSPVVTSPPFASNLSYLAGSQPKSFYAYIDVVNVTSLGAYSIGFTWNPAYVLVHNITDGGFLTSVPGSASTGLTPFTIDNTIGEVDSIANAIETPLLSPIGSGHLLKVGINVTNFGPPPYTPPFPGSFVNMLHLNVSAEASYQISIASNDTTDVTPSQSNVYSGYFKVYVTATPPIASFTCAALNYWNDTGGLETFDASASTGGNPGYGSDLPVSFYCWNWGDGSPWFNATAASGKKPSHTYPEPPGPPPSPVVYHVTLVVNSTAGTSAPVTQTFTLEFRTKHALTVSISPTSVIMDVGQSQNFTSSVSGGTSPFIYHWYLNGVTVLGAKSQNWTFSPISPDSYTVFVNVTDKDGTIEKSNIASVTVNPALSVGISPAVSFVVLGHPLTFTSAVYGGTLPYYYQWYWNGTAVPGAHSTSWTHTFTSEGSSTVYLRVTDSATPTANTQQSNTASVNDWWPMFRHDITHTGYSTSTAPITNQILWSYATGGIVRSSPAVEFGGMVFVGSQDGKVYALNATTGKQIWNYTTGLFMGMFHGSVLSSPAVDGGVVFVGAYDGKVYALNATTGNQIWNYATGWDGLVVSSPAVDGGVVFVGSENGHVYALNETTGALVWDHPTLGMIESSPAIDNGMVFVGSDDTSVYALNEVTGDLVWSYATERGIIKSSPAVAGGVVFVGSDDDNVYALNETTGALKWKFKTGGPVESSPAVAGGLVFVGSDDGRVYALNPLKNGSPVWSCLTQGMVKSSPAVAGGVVFVGSDDGTVYALDAATGKQIWTYTSGGMVHSSPAVAGGVVFVGSDDGTVYAFGRLSYNVTVKAYSITGGANLHVPITMDSSPTGYTTPHTFIGLTGTHAFTVPPENNSQPFKQWNTGETGTTVIVAYNGTETAYYRALPAVDASGSVGISGYKLVFEETISNPLGSPVTVNYYWSFNMDKWDGTQWISTGIGGNYPPTPATINIITKNLTYYVYTLTRCNVKWGDWLRIRYTFHWAYNSHTYQIDYVTKLNVHPGDIAGVKDPMTAPVTLPYFGADGRVNLGDLFLVAFNWQKTVSWTGKIDPTDALHRADINGSGKIDICDLMAVSFKLKELPWTNTPPG
jgi:outer membrane protein assembly factor BamB